MTDQRREPRMASGLACMCGTGVPCTSHTGLPVPSSVPSVLIASQELALASEGQRLCGLGFHAWMPWLGIGTDADPTTPIRYETYCVRCRHPEQFDV